MKKIVIPCSGIGKAFGTVSREATFLMTEERENDSYRTICLPLLMTDDEETKQIVLKSEVYTVDGCSKKCASVLVKHAGGNPEVEIVVPKILAENKHHKPETVLDIGEGGRLLSEDIVRVIVDHGGD